VIQASPDLGKRALCWLVKGLRAQRPRFEAGPAQPRPIVADQFSRRNESAGRGRRAALRPALCHDAEGDGVQPRPIAAHQPQPHMIAAHRIGEGDFDIGKSQERFGIAGAERPASAIARTSAGVAAAGDDTASRSSVPTASSAASAPWKLEVKEFAQTGELGSHQRKARRHGVAAAGFDQAASRAARIMRPISRPAMPRAEPLPMPPSKPATKAGLAKRSFRRPATMPTTPGCQPSPSTSRKGAFSGRRPAPPLLPGCVFETAPLLIVQVEQDGEFLRRFLRAHRQQVCAQAGASNPSAGIDARPEDKAQMISGKRRRGLGLPCQP